MMMMVENSYNGQIKQSGGKILSPAKKRRRPRHDEHPADFEQAGDEFDVCYK